MIPPDGTTVLHSETPYLAALAPTLPGRPGPRAGAHPGRSPMPHTLAFPAPPAPMSDVPGLVVLARIVEETDLDDGVRVAGELVAPPPRSGRLVTSALTEALHGRYFQDDRTFGTGRPGRARRGADFCRRVTEA